MAIGDKAGKEAVADLNRHVCSWIDSINKLVKTKRIKITIEIEEKADGDSKR